MWKRKAPEERRPRVPEDICIYTIGDVHGRADLLHEALDRVRRDEDLGPPRRSLHVFLGDYIDRGPASRQVLDRLIEHAQTHAVVYLKGNHESFPAAFLDDPSMLPTWRDLGGLPTLMSYGIVPVMNPNPAEQRRIAAEFRDRLPVAHRKFLTGLRPYFECGDYFFVHAGVRPGVPLAAQQPYDLLWIRDEFLTHEGLFPKIIVHGHTPVAQPDIRPNRINIDTGAYATGRLTCLKLQGTEITFI